MIQYISCNNSTSTGWIYLTTCSPALSFWHLASCWCKKSQTTTWWKKTVNNRKTYLQYQLVQDFFHQQYDPLCHDSNLMTLGSLAMFLFDSLPLLFLIEDLGLLSDNRISSSQHEALTPQASSVDQERFTRPCNFGRHRIKSWSPASFTHLFWGAPEIWWLEPDPFLLRRLSFKGELWNFRGVNVILGRFLWVHWNILPQHQHAFHFSKGPLFIPS